MALNIVRFDEKGVVRTMGDGRTESVLWDDLREVRIITTDEGPLTDDVFWLLVGDSGGCAVPSEADGAKDLMARLQQLPGFRNDMVIKAMASTSNAEFICWKRGQGETTADIEKG